MSDTPRTDALATELGILIDARPITGPDGDKTITAIVARLLKHGQELERSFSEETRMRVFEVELLRAARCPDPHCDNKGTIATYDSRGDTVPEQCEWCFHRDEAIKGKPHPVFSYAEKLKDAADERMVTLLMDAAFALSKVQPKNMLVGTLERAAMKLREAHKVVHLSIPSAPPPYAGMCDHRDWTPRPDGTCGNCGAAFLGVGHPVPGFWVVFDEPGEDGEMSEGFYIDAKRAATFANEQGWLRNHLEPLCRKAVHSQGTQP
jgi:hypothetical protein